VGTFLRRSVEMAIFKYMY